ncbi:FecR family protein [Pedobacter punctiformis]|uniref:FecR family protein n=1 Tax=Pedobacter punctiformis TaxID=3004097 RepID=A0ABT4L5C3_9SPHI|nr:FecR family protein [Pedobacter sp. HCMS5-2]MCZ4243126.1 FecR family protein [Pedobacter sp. HCMS5-2]
MSISDELLDKYLKGQCSPEEKLLVLQYLDKIDELPEHLLSKNEWDNTTDAIIDDAKTEEMFNVVNKHTTVKVSKLKWLKISAVAAVFLAVLTFGFLKIKQNQPKADFARHISLDQNKKSAINWKSVMNYTDHTQLLTLPDQSTVQLYPGGELRYALPFIKTKREVYLNGKSFFQVTKDKKHPFVVYAKGVSTTALGTSFTITALEKSKEIKVELHTGKVWVKNIDSTLHVLPFSKILMPGNELVYNQAINKVKVTDVKLLVKQADPVKELNFTQASLVNVFAQLQQHYKIKIIYNPADLQEMSFTGNLKLTLSIDAILEEIAELNKLNKIKTTEGYLIRK